MSNESTTVETMSDDLDTFSSEFFGQDKPTEKVEEKTNSDEIEADSDTDAKEVNDSEDTHAEEDDTSSENDEHEDDDTDEEEDVEEDEPAPKKKNRAQERIEELNKKFREQERRAQEAEARMEEVLRKLEQKNADTDTPAPKAADETEPTPDDLNEDGTDKYPLGEYDPKYIRDLTKYSFEKEFREAKQKEQQEAAQLEQDRQRAELQTTWQEKLGPARERYPDFQDKGVQLVETFNGIDPRYGEFLSATIMSMDYGPDVLYYLANNTDEARKIVESGATRATIALGRLEAKFADADEEKQKARPKVSKAPKPPEHLNKGSAQAKVVVDDDTDDLDAFASKFFKKKK